jgi:hypothetical protein
MKILYHHVQEDVVEKKIDDHDKHIPEKLCVATQVRAAEN